MEYVFSILKYEFLCVFKINCSSNVLLVISNNIDDSCANYSNNDLIKINYFCHT